MAGLFLESVWFSNLITYVNQMFFFTIIFPPKPIICPPCVPCFPIIFHHVFRCMTDEAASDESILVASLLAQLTAEKRRQSAVESEAACEGSCHRGLLQGMVP